MSTKLEEHPTQAVINPGEDLTPSTPIEQKVRVITIGGVVFFYFGTTLLQLSEVAAVEFDLDDDGEICDEGSIQFKGVSGDAWGLPESDSKLLKEWLDKR
jgi:hypothetical protein